MSRDKENWVDELVRWENSRPDYKPFTEDYDSQRQLNKLEDY